MTQKNSKRFLLVKHSQGWNVDRCCLWMEQSAHHYDWCFPACGQAFPSLDQYDGVIVFGGATSANDFKEHPWLNTELNFIENCLKQDKAFFGICLGAQMLARVHGCKVSAPVDEREEIGFFKVEPTQQGTSFLQKPLHFMQWHSEGFEIPEGATHLATSDLFANQAYSLSDKVFGVQFHPEVNLEVLRIWHERNKQSSTGVLDDEARAAHLTDAIENGHSISQWVDGFLTNWTMKAG